MKPIPLSKAIEGFFLARSVRLSPHTISDYRNTFKKFLKHVGDQPINGITASAVSAFLASQTQVSKKTVFNYHVGLSALWTWAEKDGYVAKNIIRDVEKPKPKKIVVKPFSEVELRAILSAIQHSPNRNRALILLLLDTGARASEIVSLKREDIDMSGKRIKVTGKGDKERLIPFSARTGSALFSHLATTDGDPFPFRRTSLTQYLRRLGNRAGVKDVHAHRFRHTFAITFLRNGGDPYTLQTILGHSTMEMVRIYLDIAQVDLDAAHKRASPVEGWKL
jgi:site-specific recombinase XerD